ncbi:undecaprenyl/decaprenyl-phosphate alpha-N-acetylglucosaminyl 1-phosphate transferase [Calidifontibacter sp. DB0510]|uniref:Undecaprenyl/decaprenyl-phosphate alpha-N-acetylglucosaminyl 1-phosphate transferase n=1 Tax=Metallococcus carri TaxID=1656884 RepID=A0A967B145_9MICO|nr:MraY family glycosyltransferase [Metallococcus carri]NHN56378.1 undecaprenyl/decaprenyl-phosphate alpha-N-acetylglucosaminyl 1-phosphate transferase [Metallococcus carri]NOP36002.1 undecaprenyl/decaprenyl-phosphate alpha-N-acetylglucosaminyl 1-phosphate transferase [Calidifontibacter sp. DB2511S]
MREYLLVCVIAAAITFVVTPAVRLVAVRAGAVTPVRGRDVHSVPIPRLGGVAMLVGFAAAAIVAAQLPKLGPLIRSREVLGIGVAALLITVLGALDDFVDLDAITKFAGQIVVAGIMTFAGVQMTLVPFAGTQTILPQWMLVALTVLIVIASTNAVNFVDGLDGLAAGMVAIAALAFFLFVYVTTPPNSEPVTVFSTAAFLAAAIIGCCVGFLPHNFHPAKLFMGDAGALLLGLLLAAATVSFTGNVDPGSSKLGASTLVVFWLPLVLPLSILALPVLDVLLAIQRRGLKFWKPDAKHLHHKMLAMGHPHRQAVVLLYLWALTVAGGVLSYVFWPVAVSTTVLAIGLLVCVALTLGLPGLGRRRSL